MPDTLQTLRALQEVDYEIFRVREELRRLPEERGRRRAVLDALIEERARHEEEARDWQSRVKEIEDLTSIQRQRMRKVEQEARSSRGDVALLMAYEHQVRSLKREINHAEEDGLGLLERVEGARGRIEELDGEIAQVQAEFDEYAANVQAEIDQAEGRLAKLKEERQRRFSTDLKPEVLASYERLLASRGGQALALLEGKVCQACYMGAPTNLYVRVARGLEVVHCPTCDRILYLPD